MKLKGPMFPSYVNPPKPSLAKQLAVPVQPKTRALPLGRQYIGFDRPGGQAAERRRRQMQRAAERRLRAAVASGVLSPIVDTSETYPEVVDTSDTFSMVGVETT